MACFNPRDSTTYDKSKRSDNTPRQYEEHSTMVMVTQRYLSPLSTIEFFKVVVWRNMEKENQGLQSSLQKTLEKRNGHFSSSLYYLTNKQEQWTWGCAKLW